MEPRTARLRDGLRPLERAGVPPPPDRTFGCGRSAAQAWLGDSNVHILGYILLTNLDGLLSDALQSTRHRSGAVEPQQQEVKGASLLGAEESLEGEQNA